MDKAEKLLRNLARRLEREWAGVAGSILEGIDEMLTVTRLGLPDKLRRSLACTNMIENVMGTVRRVCRNVTRWNSPSMAMRWAAAAMQDASKGFRRLKAYKQLPLLRNALLERHAKLASTNRVAQNTEAAYHLNRQRPLHKFQHPPGQSPRCPEGTSAKSTFVPTLSLIVPVLDRNKNFDLSEWKTHSRTYHARQFTAPNFAFL